MHLLDILAYLTASSAEKQLPLTKITEIRIVIIIEEVNRWMSAYR